MRTILDLQKLEAPAIDTTVFGDSSGSSLFDCCKDTKIATIEP